MTMCYSGYSTCGGWTHLVKDRFFNLMVWRLRQDECIHARTRTPPWCCLTAGGLSWRWYRSGVSGSRCRSPRCLLVGTEALSLSIVIIIYIIGLIFGALVLDIWSADTSILKGLLGLGWTALLLIGIFFAEKNEKN